MAKDPIGQRFGHKQTKGTLQDLANRARGTEDVEAEKELLEKTEKVEPIQADKAPGRNDPCPCGSGKKYKNCCGAKP